MKNGNCQLEELDFVNLLSTTSFNISPLFNFSLHITCMFYLYAFVYILRTIYIERSHTVVFAPVTILLFMIYIIVFEIDIIEITNADFTMTR